MKTCRIGRGADNDIVCSHDEVSTHHADIIEDRGSYTFVDHSKNGTIVNHSLIHNASCAVTPGDFIAFGGVEELDWKKVSRVLHTTIPIGLGKIRRPTATLRGGKDRITIGRDLQNDIVYDGQEISNSHAEIIERDGIYTLIDHSKNGTFVNGNRIQNGSCTVRYGDSIVFAGLEELNWKKVVRLLNKTTTVGTTKRIHNVTGTVQKSPLFFGDDSNNGGENNTNNNKSYGLVVLLLGLVALGIDVYLFVDFYTSTFIRLVKLAGASGLAWFPAYLNGYGIAHGKWVYIIASIVLGVVADFIANVVGKDDDKLISTGLGLANTAASLSSIFLILAFVAPYIYSDIH